MKQLTLGTGFAKLFLGFEAKNILDGEPRIWVWIGRRAGLTWNWYKLAGIIKSGELGLLLEYPEDTEGDLKTSVVLIQWQALIGPRILYESYVLKDDLAIIGVGCWNKNYRKYDLSFS